MYVSIMCDKFIFCTADSRMVSSDAPSRLGCSVSLPDCHAGSVKSLVACCKAGQTALPPLRQLLICPMLPDAEASKSCIKAMRSLKIAAASYSSRAKQSTVGGCS